MKKVKILLAGIACMLLSVSAFAQTLNNDACDGLKVDVEIRGIACRYYCNDYQMVAILEWVIESGTFTQQQNCDGRVGGILTFKLPYFCEDEVIAMKVTVKTESSNCCYAIKEVNGYVPFIRVEN